MSGVTSYEWAFAYNVNCVKKKTVNLEEVSEHPLRPLVTSVVETKQVRKFGGSTTSSSTTSSTPTPALDPLGSALDGSDPLSQFARQEMDPLSRMAADVWAMPSLEPRKKSSPNLERFEPWASRRGSILNKYTTSEKLSMVLTSGDKASAKGLLGVVVKPQATMEDKVKNRLEQLDDLEEGYERQTLELSQQEYVTRIDLMNQELVQAWNQDQRVKALKIVIQVSKMLVDVSVMQFYPSKFVLISDILDIFGRLVYDRLRTKAEYYKPGSRMATALPEDFTPDMVPETAKETCRNWFYKIASIRELVPRLYCEMAILKSYSFLTTDEFNNALMRITRMIRGIGDPLVAVYARCYLGRVGLNLSTSQAFIKENFFDIIAGYKQLSSRCVQAELTKQSLSVAAYQTLYSPALDFILQAAAVYNSELFFQHVLERCKDHIHSPLIVNTILNAFSPEIIAKRGLEFSDIVIKCSDNGFPKYQVIRSFGQCLLQAEPPESQALPILNEIWKVVTHFSKPEEYMACAQIWVSFIASHFTVREINTFLGDVHKHLVPDRQFEKYYPQLTTILKSVVSETQDIEALLTMDKFLPLMDTLQKDSVKVDVCKAILEKLAQTSQSIVNDPVVIDALMFISRVLHDSVSALTVEDEKRQIGNLISTFIKSVEFGRDLEQQLNFCVSAREAFTNLDSVAFELVHCVVRLAVTAWRVVRGHHTRKTASFVRACAAYCFITIPSISSVIHRLELYLLAGQTALLNVCLGQADACFKAAMTLIPELPNSFLVDGKMKSSEGFLVSYLGNFLSTLLIVPDNPDSGVMQLTRGLINVVKNYNWETGSSGKALVYLKALDMLHAAAQETYPYHILHVDSNDTLYGWDPKYTAELNRMASVLLDEILAHLRLLGQEERYKQQASLAMELFLQVVLKADLNQPTLANLAYNLWILAHKQGCLDPKLSQRTKEYLHRNAKTKGSDNYNALISRLTIRK